jgi:dipeptidyl aminopeptidase/acylaminoacyl peptidase
MAGLRLSRRQASGIVAALIAAAALSGYAVASNVVYDKLTTVDRAWCPAYATFAGATPGAFQTGTADTGPYVDTAPYLMPEYWPVSFPSRDEAVTIAGWWVPGASATAPAVVVVLGIGRCKGDPEVLLPAGMLNRHGFAVLLIDLRNHGDSTVTDGRNTAGVQESLDVLGAWDWLRSVEGLPADRIGLVGVSFGAGSVIDAMGREPEVAAAWEDSGFADVDVGIQDELARQGYPGILAFGGLLVGRLLHGVDLTSLSPLEAVRHLDGRPLAIVHGMADTRVPVKHAEMLAAAIRDAGGAVEPWFLPNGTHVRAAFVATAEYERRIADFFSAALGAPDGR